MRYTEQFMEHIEYGFNAFCKVVLCHEAINAWRDLKRKEEREISLDYLMSERYFEPFVIDSYFEKRTSRLYFLYWDRILKSRGKEFICLPSKNAVLLRNSIEHRKGNEYMYMCVFNEFKIVKVKIVFYK